MALRIPVESVENMEVEGKLWRLPKQSENKAIAWRLYARPARRAPGDDAR